MTSSSYVGRRRKLEALDARPEIGTRRRPRGEEISLPLARPARLWAVEARRTYDAVRPARSGRHLLPEPGLLQQTCDPTRGRGRDEVGGVSRLEIRALAACKTLAITKPGVDSLLCGYSYCIRAVASFYGPFVAVACAA